MKQLSLKLHWPVSPELKKEMKTFFEKCGRIGGLNARVTKKRRTTSRRLMLAYHAKRKQELREVAADWNTKNEKGIEAGKVFPEFIVEDGNIFLPYKEKGTNRIRLTKQITSKSPSRARGLARKKRGSYEP